MAHSRFFKLGWWLILVVIVGSAYPAVAQEGSTVLQPDNLEAVGVLSIFRPQATVVRMQFTPDSTRLIWLEQRCAQPGDGTSTPENYPVQVWDLATSTPVMTIPGCQIDDLAMNPAGTLLALAGYYGAEVVDLATGEQVQALSSNTPAEHIIFSPDGELVAVVEAQTVRVWAVASGAQTASFVSDSGQPVGSIAFSADSGQIFYSVGPSIYTWDLALAQSSAFLEATSGRDINTLVVSPDGQLLAAIDDFDLVLWTIPFGFRAAMPGGGSLGRKPVTAFSPDSRLMVSGFSPMGDPENNVGFWDTTTGTKIASPVNSPDTLLGLALSPDGTRLATVSYDTLMLWGIGAQAGDQPTMSVVGAETSGGLVDAILPLWLTPDGQSADYEITFDGQCREYNTCTYTGGYRLVMQLCDVRVTLTDQAEVIAETTLYGQVYSPYNGECPQQYAFTQMTETLPYYPTRQEFEDWLLPITSDLGFK